MPRLAPVLASIQRLDTALKRLAGSGFATWGTKGDRCAATGYERYALVTGPGLK